jgi:hypothetical protein
MSQLTDAGLAPSTLSHISKLASALRQALRRHPYPGHVGFGILAVHYGAPPVAEQRMLMSSPTTIAALERALGGDLRVRGDGPFHLYVEPLRDLGRDPPAPYVHRHGEGCACEKCTPEE